MDKPDVEVEIKRDEDGNIVGLSLKVNNDDSDGKKTLQLCELASVALNAEGPEDHSTTVDVHIGVIS